MQSLLSSPKAKRRVLPPAIRRAIDLERAFFSSRFTRKLDTLGYARFRRWLLSAEEWLACQPVAVWLGSED